MISISKTAIDIWILFGHIPEERLEIIYKDASLHIPYELFLKLYEHGTEKRYNFIFFDTRTGEFRKNFNYSYSIK